MDHVTLASALPVLTLRITAGPLTLQGITDDSLADLAIEGIHDPEVMPFSEPWSLTPPKEMHRSFAQYHWRQRADFCPRQWSAELAVTWRGDLAGVASVSATDYLVTRTASIGLWLGRRFHRQDIGTAALKAICAFVFDHLEADCMLYSAFADNLASIAVARKAGYLENGWHRMNRLGQPAQVQELSLAAGALVRYERPLAVEGIARFRQSIGLDIA